MSRLIVKMIRVPAESKDDPVAFATPILQAMSPYPDESLTVSCETVREDGAGTVVIAAALPEGSADDIAEALDERKLNVTRIDVLAIGALRGLWPVLGTDDGARRMLLLNTVDCLSVVVLDGDGPSAIRAVSSQGALKRELMLSLLEAEDFGGERQLREIVVASSAGAPEFKADGIAEFAPVRSVEIGEEAALAGVAERSADATAINALPESWRDVLEETRFKAKLTKYLVIAGAIWALLVGVVFGVPFAYGFLTDHQKTLSKDHRRAYEEVREMRDKGELVQKYSDHARGALEIIKAVSDRLPEGVTLTSWQFKREEGVRFSGEAAVPDDVWQLKDELDKIVVEDGNGEEHVLFEVVELNGPTAAKGVQKFDFDCRYKGEEER